MKRTLVLFDFDGTITTRDTLLLFIFKNYSYLKIFIGSLRLLPFLILWKLNLLSNSKAKEQVFLHFFKNYDSYEFNTVCFDFAHKVIPHFVKKKAIQLIDQYKRSGATIVVVSASPENWIKPWCNSLDINCLSTKLETIENRITGKILGQNCYGKEKEKRILESFNLLEFEKIIAYGDSSGDLAMLSLANERHFNEL